MKIALFALQDFEEEFYLNVNQDSFKHQLIITRELLSAETLKLAKDCKAVSVFVSNPLDASLLDVIHAAGIRLVLVRSTGYDHVDVQYAKSIGISVMNVPAYSPESIAEHAVSLALALLRKHKQIEQRFHQFDFSLTNMMADTVHDKTVGVIGLGNIGLAFAKIMQGFGCKLVAYDPYLKQEQLDGITLISLESLLTESDIISLHCPLNSQTHHLINRQSLAQTKTGVLLINTARGEVIDTDALLEALDSGQVAAAGLDVYEYEKGLYFRQHAEPVVDQRLMELLKRDNVILTPHIAFYTKTAVHNIAYSVLKNASDFEQAGSAAANLVNA